MRSSFTAVTLLLLATWFLAAFRASAQGPPAVPDALKPPAGETLVLRAHGVGDQVYACQGSQWVLRGPDARLTDDAGREVGSHFTGPTWQWADGSKITAKALANATPDPQSIPWLLLSVTSHEGGGALKSVTSIQRLYTTGGKAPPEACTPARESETVRSHYTADYYFYAAQK
jgi:hypothetical protein